MAQVLELPFRVTTPFGGPVTIAAMTYRIGPKKPHRVYLSEWRKHLGMTQQQVGNRVGENGVDKGIISRWENMKRVPDILDVAAYAEALGIEPRDLYRPPSAGRSLDAIVDKLPEGARAEAMEIIEIIARRAAG